MATFVVVHGSWHDGDLMRPVVSELESLGHVAHAPTLAGHGKGVSRRVKHEDCVRSLLDFLVAHDLRDVILVGHSFAGTVISRAATRCHDRLRRLVFWNAFVLEDGQCLNDAVPPGYRETFEALANQSTDGSVMLPFPVWRDAFINDADLATATATYEQLSPECYRLFTTALDMQPFYDLIRSGRLPCSYINCTEDIALPPTVEWGWHPRMSSRLGPCRVVELPGSHEVLFTNPAAIARGIVAAGSD